MTHNQTQLAEIRPLGKECTKCCVWKPFGEFYKGNALGGKHSRCKLCERSRRKDRYVYEQNEKYGEKEAERKRYLAQKKKSVKSGYKMCSQCNREKKQTLFHHCKITKNNLSSCCKSCAAKNSKERSARSPLNRLKIGFNTARVSARRKKMVFTLTVDDLFSMWESQEGRCFYTGVRMIYDGDGSDESVSLDRMDSSKGYTSDNVVLCCNRVNLMKNTMSTSELTRWCELVLEHMGEARHRNLQ